MYQNKKKSNGHDNTTVSSAAAVAGKTVQALKDNRLNAAIQKKQADAGAVTQLAANNTGLPGTLKSGIENLSGHSMDDVKVHYNSVVPAQLNAYAYAQGADIHVAPGQEKHLPHEAWHVVQQKQGRVKPTMQMKGRINVNDDSGLEKEADVMGQKAMVVKSNTQPGKLISTSALQAMRTESQSIKQLIAAKDGGSGIIQRKLKVKGTNYSELALIQNEPLFGLINSIMKATRSELQLANIPLLSEKFEKNAMSIRDQLAKWITDKRVSQRGEQLPEKEISNLVHPGPGALFGRKVQHRSYDTYLELAKALVGWVDAKPGRRQEKSLAKNVYNSPIVHNHLNNLIQKLITTIQRGKGAKGKPFIPKDVEQELTTGHQSKKSQEEQALVPNQPLAERSIEGTYRSHSRVMPPPLMTIIKNPGEHTIKEKIRLLHDLADYFGPLNIQKRPMTAGRAAYNRDESKAMIMTTGEKKKEEQKNRPIKQAGLVIEDHPAIVYAREHSLPMWSGQSATTSNMLAMVLSLCDASVAELHAVALSIFAFWRLDYDHRELSPHTLHEVMDVAHNYNVPYNPAHGADSTLTDLTILTRLENCFVKQKELEERAAKLKAIDISLELAKIKTELVDIVHLVPHLGSALESDLSKLT